MPDEASDLGEFKQNLARPRRDAAVGRREKKIYISYFWSFGDSKNGAYSTLNHPKPSTWLFQY